MNDATMRETPVSATPPSPSAAPPAAPAHAHRRRERVSAKATSSATRRHNRTLVLQTLYRSGPLSRADVSRATQLTKVTVSDLVADLIESDLVIELGQRESLRPGKPAVLVDLAREGHSIVGLDLSDHRRLRGAVLNLDGEVLARAEAPLSGAKGDAATTLTIELARALAAKSSTPVLGIGVGTPGVVDLDGVVRTAANLDWQGEPLRRKIEEALSTPAVIANDANAAALAEHNYGDGGDDMMVITIGHGVGSGLIVGGRLVSGAHFAAGEIGHVMVGTDLGVGAPYTREHTLEHWVSAPSLGAALESAGDDGREAVLREAGQRLAVALAPVVGALNLAEIVLAGPDELIEGPLAEAALDTLQRRTLADTHEGLTVRTSLQGADLVLRGAAAIVLQERLGVG